MVEIDLPYRAACKRHAEREAVGALGSAIGIPVRFANELDRYRIKNIRAGISRVSEVLKQHVPVDPAESPRSWRVPFPRNGSFIQKFGGLIGRDLKNAAHFRC